MSSWVRLLRALGLLGDAVLVIGGLLTLAWFGWLVWEFGKVITKAFFG